MVLDCPPDCPSNPLPDHGDVPTALCEPHPPVAVIVVRAQSSNPSVLSVLSVLSVRPSACALAIARCQIHPVFIYDP